MFLELPNLESSVSESGIKKGLAWKSSLFSMHAFCCDYQPEKVVSQRICGVETFKDPLPLNSNNEYLRKFRYNSHFLPASRLNYETSKRLLCNNSVLQRQFNELPTLPSLYTDIPITNSAKTWYQRRAEIRSQTWRCRAR